MYIFIIIMCTFLFEAMCFFDQKKTILWKDGPMFFDQSKKVPLACFLISWLVAKGILLVYPLLAATIL